MDKIDNWVDTIIRNTLGNIDKMINLLFKGMIKIKWFAQSEISKRWDLVHVYGLVFEDLLINSVQKQHSLKFIFVWTLIMC